MEDAVPKSAWEFGSEPFGYGKQEGRGFPKHIDIFPLSRLRRRSSNNRKNTIVHFILSSLDEEDPGTRYIRVAPSPRRLAETIKRVANQYMLYRVIEMGFRE